MRIVPVSEHRVCSAHARASPLTADLVFPSAALYKDTNIIISGLVSEWS